MPRKTTLLHVLTALFLIAACTAYDQDVPDTEANRAGFERHFGFAPPSDVTGLYYFADELGADVLYQLSFDAAPETIARIATTLNLETASADRGTPELAYTFPWWDTDDLERTTLYRKTNDTEDYIWQLWYNPGTQQAYYLEYSL